MTVQWILIPSVYLENLKIKKPEQVPNNFIDILENQLNIGTTIKDNIQKSISETIHEQVSSIESNTINIII